jgi:sugar/nucleoside kinase (ribokinase family)
MSSRYDVLAIGNPLVDIIADASDEFLATHNMSKGGMQLIDGATAEKLYGLMQVQTVAPGGSNANSVAGIASFGGKAAYIGRVKNDALGQTYKKEMEKIGGAFVADMVTTGPSTGRCFIFVTKDGQRTMNTYLGAAAEFSSSDLKADEIAAADILYLEGYLFHTPVAKKAFQDAATMARKAGRRIALTLSDTFCVEGNRAEFMAFIRAHTDILFANESEMKALYQTDDLAAITAACQKDCPLVVMTRSEKGARLVARDQVHDVPAVPVAAVVDTTGAGDLYAAGFLYGLSAGKSLSEAGHLGALAAAEVISHYGPRPLISLKDLSKKAA